MATLTHDPVAVATELAAKLATRSRHVCLLLGAGTSSAAGLPDAKGLLSHVLDGLDEDSRRLADDLYAGRDLEAGLTRLRRIRTLLGPGEEFASLTQSSARDLEKKLTAGIVDRLQAVDPDLAPMRNFASWAAGEFYRRPIEVFTVNYDLLIETGLESVGVSYFDGFVGSLRARFRPELVEPRAPGTVDELPSSFLRLWKLHGSLNWLVADDGTVVRTGAAVAQNDMAAIYPSDEKYDQSRRVPFVVLHDRLRHALAEPETLSLVAGYSFGDAHLNEVLFDSARRYPRSEIVVFCYDTIPEELRSNIQPNITVIAASDGIISGERAEWANPGTPIAIEVWDGAACRLGDFGALSKFLAKAPRTSAVGVATALPGAVTDV